MKPEDFGITKYKFRPDGTLDVFQDVYLVGKSLKELPFKFGKVDGDFNCNYNKLTILKGCPEIVNGNFYCSGNNLTSLIYFPKIINGSFHCSNNSLKSLNGLNLDGIIGVVSVWFNPNLKLTDKEELWATLNPGRLVKE